MRIYRIAEFVLIFGGFVTIAKETSLLCAVGVWALVMGVRLVGARMDRGL